MSQLASERPIIAGNAADGAPAALVAAGYVPPSAAGGLTAAINRYPGRDTASM